MPSTVKLAELWQRMGYRVVCVCMGHGGGKKGEKRKESEEVVSDTLTIYRVKDFFLPDPLNYGIAPTFVFHVLRALKKEKPDIVIVNKVLFWSSLVTPLLRLLGKNPIVTTDALVGMTWHPRRFIPKVIMTIGAWTAGWMVLISAKKVIFFHPQPERLLKMLGIRKKSQVIPTGIDETKYGGDKIRRFEDSKGQTLRQGSGQGFETSQKDEGQKSIKITYVGRLESVKGVDDFLAAAVPVKEQYPLINIQVVGWYPSTSSGQARHPLVKQYQDKVTFTGLRHDIPHVLSETDIFVLPSYSEGLSNALMEAMSSACACIASEVGGNCFLIENGISGFLFPPGDRAMLKSHILRLIEDVHKREALGSAARGRIEKVFSWRVIEKKYATLFAEI